MQQLHIEVVRRALLTSIIACAPYYRLGKVCAAENSLLECEWDGQPEIDIDNCSFDYVRDSTVFKDEPEIFTNINCSSYSYQKHLRN